MNGKKRLMMIVVLLFSVLPTAYALGATESTAILPARYDAREDGLVTAIETQISGTCWAHATIAALESNAIKQGLADNSLDLNEYHLVWNTQNGYSAGVTDSKNDGLSKSDFSAALTNGSTVEKAGYTLTGFAGAVSEEKYPVTATTKKELMKEMADTFSFSNKYEREITVGEIIDIGTDPTDMKKAILQYGGLYYAFIYYSGGFSEFSQSGEPVQTYFRKDTTSTKGDHAVELIGWDDNFSIENFGEGNHPKKPGAWLLKNSKGTDWGSDGGFFWISYEDPGLYSCVAVTAVSTDEYEKVFMHDGIGTWGTVSCTAAANIFKSDEDVLLTKFSTGAALRGGYSMQIYLLHDGNTDPTDGELLYQQSGIGSGRKYIDLSGQVEISAGSRFSVVINGISSCNVEGATQGEWRFTSNPGESYYYQNGWIDSSTAGKNNVCIRVIAQTPCSWKLVSSSKGSDCRHTGEDTYVCTKCGAAKTEPNQLYGDHFYLGSRCLVCGNSRGPLFNITKIAGSLFSRIFAFFK